MNKLPDNFECAVNPGQADVPGVEYAEDGRPKRCSCGCPFFHTETKDTINHIVCEQEWFCLNCGRPVAYWAYGAFDPAYYKESTKITLTS